VVHQGNRLRPQWMYGECHVGPRRHSRSLLAP
jgi:hypothetical protein